MVTRWAKRQTRPLNSRSSRGSYSGILLYLQAFDSDIPRNINDRSNKWHEKKSLQNLMLWGPIYRIKTKGNLFTLSQINQWSINMTLIFRFIIVFVEKGRIRRLWRSSINHFVFMCPITGQDSATAKQLIGIIWPRKKWEINTNWKTYDSVS